MAKKRTNDPDDPIIYPRIFFFEEFTMADAMEHQSNLPLKYI
jgi:hypothetical protein